MKAMRGAEKKIRRVNALKVMFFNCGSEVVLAQKSARGAGDSFRGASLDRLHAYETREQKGAMEGKVRNDDLRLNL